MAFGDGDLDVFTQDFGVPVSFAGAPAGLRGIVEVADGEQLARDGLAPVMGTTRYVVLRSSAASALAADAAITVDSVGYTVLKLARFDDGALTRVYLQDT